MVWYPSFSNWVFQCHHSITSNCPDVSLWDHEQGVAKEDSVLHNWLDSLDYINESNEAICILMIRTASTFFVVSMSLRPYLLRGKLSSKRAGKGLPLGRGSNHIQWLLLLVPLWCTPKLQKLLCDTQKLQRLLRGRAWIHSFCLEYGSPCDNTEVCEN